MFLIKQILHPVDWEKIMPPFKAKLVLLKCEVLLHCMIDGPVNFINVNILKLMDPYEVFPMILLGCQKVKLGLNVVSESYTIQLYIGLGCF